MGLRHKKPSQKEKMNLIERDMPEKSVRLP
jgi:hypothetical protein